MYLSIGLVSVDAMERRRGVLLSPWQTGPGQSLLLAAAIVHAGLGLASLASRHSLAMSRTDWVQLSLGLTTPPLLVNHVVGLRVTNDLVTRFNADYGYVLAVYWRYAPLFALQQLLVIVIVWAHGDRSLFDLGVEARLAATGANRRPDTLCHSDPGTPRICAAGEAVLARLASDDVWRALVEQNLQIIHQMRHRLDVVQSGVFLVYGIAVAVAVGILVANILRRRRSRVVVSYDGALTAVGHVGMSVVEVSRANHIPHASVCGGRGRCGTCRIIVPADADLDAPAEAELATLRRVVCAVDCGTVVNPDTVRAQIESAIIFGITAALNGEITLKNGRVEQTNFDTYQILRMNEAPAIEVHVVQSSEPPAGMGEGGTSAIVPAVAYAIFAATGKRLRKMPVESGVLKKRV